MGAYLIAAGNDDGEEAAGVWTGGAAGITLSSTDIAAFRFTTVPVNSFTDTGIFQATPLSRTNNATTIQAMTLRLFISTWAAGDVTVSFVDELDPAAFGASPNLPSERTVVEACTFTLGGALNGMLDIPLFTGTPAASTAQIAGTTAADLSQQVENFSRLQLRHRSLDWNGKLAFTVTRTGAGTLNIRTQEEGANFTPVLTLTEVPQVTGINKHWQAHSRADRCPRCGTLTVREKLVEDGFKRGLLVCRSCWDPPDFHSQWGRRGVGREREGIND